MVERPDGRAIAKPVELRVMVGDANDNRPTFPQAQYHTVVKELAARGSWHLLHVLEVSTGKTFTVLTLSTGTEILTVQAADNDDPKTDNVRIFYRLVGQIPESPRALFRVDRDSGVISVQADSMEGTAPQYTLTITAEDAKGDFNENYIQNLWFNNWMLILLWHACLFYVFGFLFLLQSVITLEGTVI